MNEVGYYAGNRETFVSNYVSHRDEAVPDQSSTRDNTQFDFIVNMLCNNERGSGEQDTETKLCEIRGHLQTEETKLTLRSLTLYIYGAPILDVSRSHTTTQHSR